MQISKISFKGHTKYAWIEDSKFSISVNNDLFLETLISNVKLYKFVEANFRGLSDFKTMIELETTNFTVCELIMSTHSSSFIIRWGLIP